MKPIIGITTSIMTDSLVMQMNQSYPQAIEHAGGIPLLLPSTEEPETIRRYAGLVDGLLLSGGDDVDPMCYGAMQSWACGDICPLRDRFEMSLCCRFLETGKPLLGICRGIQLLNVAMGGTLYQDLAQELPGSIAHRQKQKPWHASHPVKLLTDSRLQQVFASDAVLVNSHHHQAIRDLAEGLTATAWAPDGVIEAVEHQAHPFCLAVQWHPERLWDQPGSTTHAQLFSAFVNACSTSA